jgi:hypothetical protein
MGDLHRNGIIGNYNLSDSNLPKTGLCVAGVRAERQSGLRI